MNNITNGITQAVIFTVRNIESKKIFENVAPEASSQLIDYLVSRNDSFSSWLNKKVQRGVIEEKDEVSIDEFKLIPDEVQKKMKEFDEQNGPIKEDSSLIEIISNAKQLDELQEIKSSFIYILNELSDEEKNEWKSVCDFISKIPDASESDMITSSNLFSIEDYNDDIATTIIDESETHCDKQNSTVQDRLGWYRKEDVEGKTVACAVNPWIGETTPDHNIKWASALINTVTEKYNSLESILLVCHDRDFSGFSGKDEVVTGQLFDQLKELFKPRLKCLIVFQHSNKIIMGALSKEKAVDVFNVVKEYSEGFGRLGQVDKENQNACAHESLCKIKKEE